MPGRWWSTQVTVTDDPKHGTWVALRLNTLFPKPDHPTFTFTIPRIFKDITRDYEAYADDMRLLPEPFLFRGNNADDVTDFFHLLEQQDRILPIVVISLPNRAGTNWDKTPIDPFRIAKNCMGLSHVFVIDNEMSEHLIQKYGKNMATYNGAIRTYNTDFKPFDQITGYHPFILSSGRLSPSRIENIIERGLFERSVGFRNFDPFIPTFTQVQGAALLQKREEAVAGLVSETKPTDREIVKDEKEVENLRSLVSDLKDRLKGLDVQLTTQRDIADNAKDQVDDAIALAAEEERKRIRVEEEATVLKEENAVLLTEIFGLKATLSSLQKANGKRLVTPRKPIDITEIPDPVPDYKDMPVWIQENLAKKVVVPKRAVEELSKAIYRDRELVLNAVLLLAVEYRDMKLRDAEDDGLYKEFVTAMGVLGLREGESVQKAYQKGGFAEQYSVRIDGIDYELDRHLIRGNRKNDKDCLRIYFSSTLDPKQRVVIGHLPSHLDNRLT